MKTPQELINEKATKIQHYCRDGFNTIQTIELMEEYAAQFKTKIKEDKYYCKLCNESECYGECLMRKESEK